MAHPNVAVVRRLYQAFMSRSEAMLGQLAGEEMAFHVPGRSAFAGTYRGRDQILELFRSSGLAADRSIKIQLHDIIGNTDHVVGLHHMKAARPGRVLDQDACVICHVKDGKIRDLWLVFEDVRQWDEFFE